MIIDFNLLKEEQKENFKDGSGVLLFNVYRDERNKIFKVTINPKCSVGFHRHEKSQEIMYLLQGELEAHDDDKITVLKEGQVQYCQDGHAHELKNNSDKPAVLICSVTFFD